MIARKLGALAAAASLLPAVVAADQIDKSAGEIYELEQDARRLDTMIDSSYKAREASAEHRLVDAQMHMGLGDYSNAAILLFDIAEKYPDSRAYPEAVFYLGEALYQMDDFLLARIHFARAAERAQGREQQKALQRLIELAMRTGDHTNADDYLAQLARIPPAQLEPSVPYVRAKYHYFSDSVDEAIVGFSAIGPGTPYHMQALYFVGVCQTKKGDFQQGMAVFDRVLALNAVTPEQRRIQELAHLALGRLHYEAGEVPVAMDHYQAVSRDSDLFDSALYEVAWVHIRAGDFKKALQALELLLLAQPDSTLAPQVQILEGNLLIRNGKYGKATDVFAQTRQQYDPLYRDLHERMTAQPDPSAYVDAILGRSFAATEIAVLPRLAVSWAREEPDIMKFVGMAGNLREIGDELSENEKLLQRLERGVRGPAKARIFPDLAVARARSLEIDNRLVLARDRLTNVERDVVGRYATPEEKEKLAALAAERKALQDEIRNLPSTPEQFESRATETRSQFDRIDKLLAEMQVLIESQRSEVAAMETYFAESQGVEAAASTEFQQVISEAKEVVAELDTEVQGIRSVVADARSQLGVGDAMTSKEVEVKRRYNDVLKREHALHTQIAARLPANERAKVERVSAILAQAANVEAILIAFQGKLDSEIDTRLGDVLRAIEQERSLLGEYQVKKSEYDSESTTVGKGVVHGGFQRVLRRFYDVVVQSDVGIIDVAWALKQEKTDNVSRLVRDQNAQIKGLEREFNEVMEDTQ